MSKISVVIPAYNSEKTIAATVSSVLDQTFADLEVIVINDGSTDKTLDIVEEFTDPRVQCFSYENGGLPTARNRGISHATGEYISFLDSDDLWTKDKLSKQLDVLTSSASIGAVYSWTYNMFDIMYGYPKNIAKAAPVFYQGNVYSELLIYNFLGHGSNLLMKRSVLDEVGHFDPDFKVAEDWEFYLRIARRWDFGLVPEYQIFYRKTSTSMSSDMDGYCKRMLHAIDQIYTSVPDEYQYKKDESILNWNMYLSEKSLEFPNSARNFRLALEYLAVVAKAQPSFIVSKRFGSQLKRLVKYWFRPAARYIRAMNSGD